ncbi:N-acetylmuramoyl-L-alanine amidase [Phyllobacterium sp. YR531]|uniref:N-acetylmuramoyl-L-alanine amidase n=1 Tax=Phyllobacterium sp. YR531 TaxID=1144343 RepID=UPI00026FB240|nr:N-acetylmuramoyl-L-alanine amidase [Phyllobacterium sp. YR531]EJN04218.1 negative regulator of beta-lactamase expression [Phyllobacterium sp. YR531]
MTTILDNQKRLTALGIDVGVLDGKAGQKYHDGVALALDRLKVPVATIPPVDSKSPVTAQPKATRAINEIIIHCTATPEGSDVSVETIRGWHKAQGWKDIGYHYVVLLDGTVQPGRPEAQIGSHVAGHNTGTLGIVYVGGVAKDGKTAKDTRTPAQKAALIATVKALISKYPAIKKVTGHKQYAAKACPSFDVRKDALGSII